MKKIVHLDKNARIVIGSGNYILQYRRNSKTQISWSRGKYFSDLTASCLEYLNSSPVRDENTINSTQELIEVIKDAENKIITFLKENKNL